jgi:hypothetical protein
MTSIPGVSLYRLGNDGTARVELVVRSGGGCG